MGAAAAAVTARQTDPLLRRRVSGGRTAVVIPVGAVEQHGAHLPVSTDFDIVTEVASRVGGRLGALVLPTITYGVSREHAPLFQASVTGTTLQRQIADLCGSLGSGGMTRAFVINGHHGNQAAVEGAVGRVNARTKGIRAYGFSYWRFMQDGFDHAGFVETSLMLAVAGKSVRMGRAVRGFDPGGLSPAELRRAGARAAVSFTSVAPNGVWGDPRKATKKDGERMLAEIVKNLTKRCRDCIAKE